MNAQIHQTGIRLLDLRRKLVAREGTPGYEKNCEALQAEIVRLEGSTIQSVTETTSTSQPVASEE